MTNTPTSTPPATLTVLYYGCDPCDSPLCDAGCSVGQPSDKRLTPAPFAWLLHEQSEIQERVATLRVALGTPGPEPDTSDSAIYCPEYYLVPGHRTDTMGG